MSEAASTQQQLDIVAILENTAALADIAIMAEVLGDTVVAMQNRIAGKFTTDKSPGCGILVKEPVGKPEQKETSFPKMILTHKVLVMENTMLNRKQDGTGDTTSGTNGAKLRDIVIQALHFRHLGRAGILWAGYTPQAKEGENNYEVAFEIIDDLPTENRAAIGHTVSGTTVTLFGTVGEAGQVIRYTTDGSSPVPGGATVTTYTVPFIAASGTTVRASVTATGKAISSFEQFTIP